MGGAISLGRDDSDELLEKAYVIDATVRQFAMRLKPRFSTLLKLPIHGVLDWGEQNLAALRGIAAKNAEIAAAINLIDPAGWIKRASEAAMKQPGFFDRFKRDETPAYYETRLNGIRPELVSTLSELHALHAELVPDIEDLRMDIVSLQVVLQERPNQFDQILAHERVRTLIAAQQTVVMVVQALENLRMACAQHVQTIDKLLSTVLPNWALAKSRST